MYTSTVMKMASKISELIELAKTRQAPVEIEKGEIIGGFAHARYLFLADQVVEL